MKLTKKRSKKYKISKTVNLSRRQTAAASHRLQQIKKIGRENKFSADFH